MKLKVGDKVKILKNERGSVNKVGDIGIIIERHILSSNLFRVNVKGRKDLANNHPEHELKKID